MGNARDGRKTEEPLVTARVVREKDSLFLVGGNFQFKTQEQAKEVLGSEGGYARQLGKSKKAIAPGGGTQRRSHGLWGGEKGMRC